MGAIIAVIAPMTGIFLVVRRYSSLADALSHVALAGVSIGLLTHTQPVITTLIVTVAAAILIEYLRDQKKIFGESLLTIFLSAGLAITTLVMSRVASSTDTIFQLLFGSISTVSPQDVMITFILGLAVFFVFFVLYKELFFVSFDQDLAKSNGLRVRFYNVLLVTTAAVTIALSMRIVGVLLIGSLMVIPVITALQFRRGFTTSLFLSIGISLLSVFAGLFAAYYLDFPSGGAIVFSALLLFLFRMIL